MLDPLPRQPLAQRSALWLSNAICDGVWSGHLPGERTLCVRLGISRPILREALKLLEQKGIISCEPNRFRRIIAPPLERALTHPKVIFLIGGTHLQEKTSDDPLVSAACNALAKQGIEIEIRTQTTPRSSLLKQTLRKEIVWVLVSVSEATQRWFHEREIPAIVAGSTYPGISLASIDVDHRAISRHATGEFLRLGHRRIAMIATERPRAGDLETEEAFFTSLRQAPHEGIVPSIIRSRPEPEELCRNLRRALITPTAPTGLFICHPHLAVTALTYTQSLGIKVPKDLSIICRDSAYFLAYTHPSIAGYELCWEGYTKIITRMIRDSSATQETHRLFPKFHTGKSIGPAPAILE